MIADGEIAEGLRGRMEGCPFAPALEFLPIFVRAHAGRCLAPVGEVVFADTRLEGRAPFLARPAAKRIESGSLRR